MFFDEPEGRSYIGRPHSGHGRDGLYAAGGCELDDHLTLLSPDMDVRRTVLSRQQEDYYAEPSFAKDGGQENITYRMGYANGRCCR